MRLQLDPLPGYKNQAIEKVEKQYSFGFGPKLIAYAHKRAAADAVKLGQVASIEFVEAARIEGLEVDEFADLIVSKPNEVMVFENSRRNKIMRIKSASTLQEVDIVVKELTNG